MFAVGTCSVIPPISAVQPVARAILRNDRLAKKASDTTPHFPRARLGISRGSTDRKWLRCTRRKAGWKSNPRKCETFLALSPKWELPGPIALSRFFSPFLSKALNFKIKILIFASSYLSLFLAFSYFSLFLAFSYFSLFFTFSYFSLFLYFHIFHIFSVFFLYILFDITNDHFNDPSFLLEWRILNRVWRNENK